MNTKKLLIVCGLAVAAVSANATITLANGGPFTLSGAFAGSPALPSFGNSPTTTVSITSVTSGLGSIQDWWFSAVESQTNTNLGTLNFVINVSGVTPTSLLFGSVTVLPYNPVTNTQGSTAYGTMPVLESIASGSATVSVDVTNFAATQTAFIEGDFWVTDAVPEPAPVAVLGVGALGLLIRRRRSK